MIAKERCLEYALSITSEHTEFLRKQSAELEKQKEELELIYGFLPEKIVNEINESKAKLNEILSSIEASEYLLPLKPKIEEISQYLSKTEKVIKNYENIYLNIIKPIKNEGKQGIKATATWAILSIIVTAILSFYFSYKTFDKGAITDTQAKSVNYLRSSGDLSPLEQKVDFLTKEVMGLNEPFQGIPNSLTFNQFEEEILFLSQKDTITMKPWAFFDYTEHGTCYSSVDILLYLNKRPITTQMIKSIFLKKSKVNPGSYTNMHNAMSVVEKDTLIFENHSILIEKIFSHDSQCSPFGDKINAIRVIKLR